MATTDQAYQEFYRRQHLVLGAYLAIHCWHGGYDAVIVSRETLAHIHELSRFTEKHLSWLQQDIRPYFRDSQKLYYKRSNLFAAVVLSRVEIPGGFGSGWMQDLARAKHWRAKDYRVATLSELSSCEDTFTEKTATTFLALASTGLAYPHAYFK